MSRSNAREKMNWHEGMWEESEKKRDERLRVMYLLSRGADVDR
jgi:hypothetical protein